MKHKSIILSTTMYLLLVGLVPPALAGLGSASKAKVESYDVWCGEVKNDCKVSFKDGKISVNESDSVGYENVVSVSQDFDMTFWGSLMFVYGVEYVEGDSEQIEFAQFMVQHERTSDMFWRDLLKACLNAKEVNLSKYNCSAR